MPKILNYPRSSFKQSLEVAEATSALGGTCDIETCAHKLNKKVSGAFRSIVASAQKFGLIEYEKGQLSITERYKLIKHSYSDKEELKILREAFLLPEVFNDLYTRFLGNLLPIDTMEKMLIREYEVDEKISSRVSKYFIDGLKDLELLDNENRLMDIKTEASSGNKEKKDVKENSMEEEPKKEKRIVFKASSVNEEKKEYIIQIMGPGLETSIILKDEDDMLILEATLNKVRKALKGSE